MRRRALMAASMPNGGGNLITFYINDIECHAEDGMTFKEWILSDYFDITNPYSIMGANPNMDVREFVELYGDDFPQITSSAGMIYTPQIFTYNTIIPNCSYTLNTGGFWE